jgi:hypothetical protein
MHGFAAPWAIAGGWAVDLFLGFESRAHADIDVAILRADQHELRSRLASAELTKVVDHQLSPWGADDVLVAPVHEVHARWPDGFQVEFLLNDFDPTSAEWLFRRDHRIRRPLDTAFAANGGIPYLAPELVLLYKSNTASAKDQTDFDVVGPHLSTEQRSWLSGALAVTAPGHRWASILMEKPDRKLPTDSGSAPIALPG